MLYITEDLGSVLSNQPRMNFLEIKHPLHKIISKLLTFY